MSLYSHSLSSPFCFLSFLLALGGFPAFDHSFTPRDDRTGERARERERKRDWKKDGGVVVMVFQSGLVWAAFGAFEYPVYFLPGLHASGSIELHGPQNVDEICWHAGIEGALRVKIGSSRP